MSSNQVLKCEISETLVKRLNEDKLFVIAVSWIAELRPKEVQVLQSLAINLGIPPIPQRDVMVSELVSVDKSYSSLLELWLDAKEGIGHRYISVLGIQRASASEEPTNLPGPA